MIARRKPQCTNLWAMRTGKAGPGDEAVLVKALDRKQERVGALFVGFGDPIDGIAIAKDFLLARIARKGAQTMQIV